MEVHPACSRANNLGWVEIDHEKKIAINCVENNLHEKILSSEFYKNKEGIFWPKIEKTKNYKSKIKTFISYYKTEYLNNIIRYPEYTPKQLKETILFLCDILIYCKNHGYFLGTHLWNLTYVKGRPILIDIRDFFIYNNQDFKTVILGHFREKLDNHCPIHIKNFFSNWKEIKNNILKSPNNIEKIKEILEGLKPIQNNEQLWSDYHKEKTNFLLNSGKLDLNLYNNIKNYKGGCGIETKSKNLFGFVEKLNYDSFIEMGCNNGLYSFGLSYEGKKVVGIDYSISCIDVANQLNKKLQTNCVFLKLDILDEKSNEKTYGMNGSYGNIYSRLVSDVLVAPAVIHHLYNSCKSMDKIIRIFDKFAKKCMILEIIPSIFSEKLLSQSLNKFNWKIIEKKDSSPSPRTWVLCVRN